MVNVGGTPAKITDGLCHVFWDNKDTLPMRRPYEGKDSDPLFPHVLLQPGQSFPVPFQSEEIPPSDHSNIVELNIYVMGWIEYADDNGTRRRTAFCRLFKRQDQWGNGRFYPVADPDYEHEE